MTGKRPSSNASPATPHPSATADLPPRREKLPSLIDDEPVSIGRVTGASFRPTTVSTTMKGLGPLAGKEGEATLTGLSPLSYFDLAEAVVQREDFAPEEAEESVRALSRMLRDDPSNETALLYRAKLLVRLNRSPEALADLDELLSINPHHPEGQTEVAALRAKLASP